MKKIKNSILNPRFFFIVLLLGFFVLPGKAQRYRVFNSNVEVRGDLKVDSTITAGSTDSLSIIVAGNEVARFESDTSIFKTPVNIYKGHLLPSNNISYDLGGPVKYWRNIYSPALYLGSGQIYACNTINGSSNIIIKPLSVLYQIKFGAGSNFYAMFNQQGDFVPGITNKYDLGAYNLCFDTAYISNFDNCGTTQTFNADTTEFNTNAVFNNHVIVNNGIANKADTATVSKTITINDNIIFVNTTGGAVTITLPAIATIPNGQSFTIFAQNVSGGNITIVDSGGGSIINGAANYIMDLQYESVTITKYSGQFYITNKIELN
jgi:hypothetical protein